MNQKPPNIRDIHSAKTMINKIPDREKIVVAYHTIEQGRTAEAIGILSSVSQDYYLIQFHKDIARALLCWATRGAAQDFRLAKESEFYLIVYRLMKFITENQLTFDKGGYFYELMIGLFKDVEDAAEDI